MMEAILRFGRQGVRAVYALRDLRRYSPAVFVNNQGGQMNVASDGGQQTNVVKKEKKKRTKAHDAATSTSRKLQARSLDYAVSRCKQPRASISGSITADEWNRNYSRGFVLFLIYYLTASDLDYILPGQSWGEQK
jgi:hypothetical protein